MCQASRGHTRAVNTELHGSLLLWLWNNTCRREKYAEGQAEVAISGLIGPPSLGLREYILGICMET